jgi:outer membrane protein TolC
LENQRQQVALETRIAYLRLKKALDLVPTLKAQTEYAREAVRLAGERYQQRLGSLVELNQAEAALAEAEARELTQVYAVKGADAELQFAIGRR